MSVEASTKDPELSAKEARAKKFNIPVVLTEAEKQAKRESRFKSELTGDDKQVLR